MTKRARHPKRRTSGIHATGAAAAASLRTIPAAGELAPIVGEDTHAHPPRGVRWAGLSLERQLILWGMALLLGMVAVVMGGGALMVRLAGRRRP